MNTSCENLSQVQQNNIITMISVELQIRAALADWIAFGSIFSLKTGLHQYGHTIDERLRSLWSHAKWLSEKEVSSDEIMATHVNLMHEKLSYCTGRLRDVCLIARIQSIIHYKISLYATSSPIADLLGEPDLVGLFQDAVWRETKMNDFMTYLAGIAANKSGS